MPEDNCVVLSVAITPEVLAEAITESSPDMLIEVIKAIDQLQGDWQGFTLPLVEHFLDELIKYTGVSTDDDSEDALHNEVMGHLAEKLKKMVAFTLSDEYDDEE